MKRQTYVQYFSQPEEHICFAGAVLDMYETFIDFIPLR